MNEKNRKILCTMAEGAVRAAFEQPMLKDHTLDRRTVGALVANEMYRILEGVPDELVAGVATPEAGVGALGPMQALDRAFEQASAMAHERDQLLYQISKTVSAMAAFHSNEAVRSCAVELGRATASFRYVKNKCDVAAHAGGTGSGNGGGQS